MTELPRGWALTDIGTLGRYINGRGFGKAEWRTNGLPIIRIQNLNDETAAFNYSNAVHEEKYRVKDGDLLVAWAASLGVYIWKRGPAWLNQHIFRVEVEERLVSKAFLYYSLKHALEALYKKAHGSGMVHVTKDRFDEHPIKLPPLNEQGRIVSKIDELFSRIEEGERALERAQKLLERYRQSVLKAAVTGELTRDWREQRKCEPESGEALLQRILRARREAWEKTELDKMKAKGIEPANDKWKQRYQEPALPDTTHLPELPHGWCWLTVESLCFVTKLAGFEYTKFVRYDDDGDLAVIKAENAGRKGFKWTPFSKVRAATVSHLTRSRLKPGDLLMVFVGAGTGNVARVPADQEYFLGPNIAMLRVTSDCVQEQYLEQYLRSPIGNALTLTFMKAVAQPSLSMGTIRQIAVALPPLDEQRMIVDCIARLSESGAQLQKEAQTRLQGSGALRTSLLASAFCGTLVPQNPADEPASVLLERIAEERGTGERGTARPAIMKRTPQSNSKDAA